MRRITAVILSIALSGAVTAMAGSPPANAASSDPDATSSAGMVQRASALAARTTPAGSSADSPSADAATATAGQDGDLTGLLTQLRLGLDSMSPADAAEAKQLLARPTDGAADPVQNGYTTAEAPPVCSVNFCVHYVTTTEDAPASTDANANGVPDQVETTLDLMERVLAFESGTLGFRPPATDGTRGGDARFDVYLSQIGDGGLYGYCAPESRVQNRQYSGYCVLDNDFIEFPLGPANSLTVTAAHEFFHAIQFNYNAASDPWFMEATATWMEEQFADDVNDNRQYIRASQLKDPETPLDYFGFGEGQSYGNWIFFEYLSSRYGTDAVRSVWESVDSGPGGRRLLPPKAVAKFASRHGTTFPDLYASFAAANLTPAKHYSEGSAWPKPAVTSSRTLAVGAALTAGAALDHLTSSSYLLRPKKSLKNTAKLRLNFNIPDKATGATVAVRFYTRDGKVRSRNVKLNKSGAGTTAVKFGPKQIRQVSVTLANASYRMASCNRRTPFTCAGLPKDDDRNFYFTARVK